jgi:hypothetical protein
MEIGSLSTALATSYVNNGPLQQSNPQQAVAETRAAEQRQRPPEVQESNQQQAPRPVTNTDG